MIDANTLLADLLHDEDAGWWADEQVNDAPKTLQTKEDHIVFDWTTTKMKTMISKTLTAEQHKENEADRDFINATITMKSFCIMPVEDRHDISPLFYVRYMMDKGLKTVVGNKVFVCSDGKEFRAISILCRRLDATYGLVGNVLFTNTPVSAAAASSSAEDASIVKVNDSATKALVAKQKIINFFWDVQPVSIDQETLNLIY